MFARIRWLFFAGKEWGFVKERENLRKELDHIAAHIDELGTIWTKELKNQSHRSLVDGRWAKVTELIRADVAAYARTLFDSHATDEAELGREISALKLRITALEKKRVR